MMRKSIRQRIQLVLKNANTLAKSNVFCRKSTPHNGESLPYILIYPNQENVETHDMSPKRYKKQFIVSLELVCTHDDDAKLCDEMDALSEQVEVAIESDYQLQGWEDIELERRVENTQLISVQMDAQGDGSNPSGAVLISYMITYLDDVVVRVPDDEFINVDIGYEIGDHGDNKVTDNVDIPQDE